MSNRVRVELVLKLRCDCGVRWEYAHKGRRMPTNRELLLAMRCPMCGSTGEATGEPIEVRPIPHLAGPFAQPPDTPPIPEYDRKGLAP